jgi:hypothetical protein
MPRPVKPDASLASAHTRIQHRAILSEVLEGRAVGSVGYAWTARRRCSSLLAMNTTTLIIIILLILLLGGGGYGWSRRRR